MYCYLIVSMYNYKGIKNYQLLYFISITLLRLIPTVTLFCHSFWHLTWMAYIFLHSILAFYLTFYSGIILISYLASFLASILTFSEAFYLAFFLQIYLASILTFFLASIIKLWQSIWQSFLPLYLALALFLVACFLSLRWFLIGGLSIWMPKFFCPITSWNIDIHCVSGYFHFLNYYIGTTYTAIAKMIDIYIYIHIALCIALVIFEIGLPGRLLVGFQWNSYSTWKCNFQFTVPAQVSAIFFAYFMVTCCINNAHAKAASL